MCRMPFKPNTAQAPTSNRSCICERVNTAARQERCDVHPAALLRKAYKRARCKGHVWQGSWTQRDGRSHRLELPLTSPSDSGHPSTCTKRRHSVILLADLLKKLEDERPHRRGTQARGLKRRIGMCALLINIDNGYRRRALSIGDSE